jgi:protein-S-isoprenylcysteine O-methyltransferase Ste14
MLTRRTVLAPAVWGFYLVIVLEFLFMISPLALHFYSSYGPVLNLLHRSPATAWLTSFFLPHFSRTTSPLLNMSKKVGLVLAALGFTVFLWTAVQVYAAKLRRRGAVTGGLYRWVRHPQYLALGVLGLGITLIWARFLVLLSWVTMLFLYGALARWEEQQCLQKYGDSYRRLQERTGAFLPRSLANRFTRLFGRRTRGASLLRYAAAMVIATAAAFALRAYSLAHVTSRYGGGVAILSPALLSQDELEQAFSLASSDEVLRGRLRYPLVAAPLLVYVVPVDWYMPDLPLYTLAEILATGGGHRTPPGFDRSRYWVLFTHTRTYTPAAAGPRIVTSAYGRDPVLMVEVDLAANRIVRRKEPPATVVWGDIPTPMF